MTIRESEDKLFAEWSARHPRFVADGVIDEASYITARTRVLFLLKEVDDADGGGWDLRNIDLLSSVWQTWNNLARWAYGLLNDTPWMPWSSVPESNSQFRRNWLQYICAVNIKKVGGGSSADAGLVSEYANEDSAFLRRQLALYRPQLTICCGTADYLHYVYAKEEFTGWRATSNGTLFSTHKDLGTVINYYHPQARYPANSLYTMLIEAVKELKIPQ